VLFIALSKPVRYQRVEEVPRDSLRSFHNIDSKETQQDSLFYRTQTQADIISLVATDCLVTTEQHRMSEDRIVHLTKQVQALQLEVTELQQELRQHNRCQQTPPANPSGTSTVTNSTVTNTLIQPGDCIRITNQVKKPLSWDNSIEFNQQQAKLVQSSITAFISPLTTESIPGDPGATYFNTNNFKKNNFSSQHSLQPT
jgi:hypothetical protein